MRWLAVLLFVPWVGFAQVVPTSSSYNADIVWESVFTDGPAGKVNRGVADSEGHIGLVFMPEGMTRVHRIHGETGALLWTRSIEGTAGFGIAVYEAADGPDYIVTGGIGDTQERWMARLDGADGSTVWSKTYTASAGGFDGIRMAITGSDGMLYGAGFTGGDEAGTIFVVYAGAGNVVKVHPADGALIWSQDIPGSEYVLAVAEAEETLFAPRLNGTPTSASQRSAPRAPCCGRNHWAARPTSFPMTSRQMVFICTTVGTVGARAPGTHSISVVSKPTSMGRSNGLAITPTPADTASPTFEMSFTESKRMPRGVYLFGGTGDESGYSEQMAPYESSDVWNGWALKVSHEGDILHSAVFCQDEVNTATEYGCLIDGGYVLFNDTDAGGDTEVGVMRVAEPLTSGVTESHRPIGLVDVVHRQGACIVVPHQPVKCTVLDALGRILWSAEVGGPMELPGSGTGWSFLEVRSGARAEIHRLPPH